MDGRDALRWRKNPLTMVGTLRRCWLFTRQTPADDARRILPPQLELVTHRGLAFWNVVVCQIEAMRPRGLPAFAGVGYKHAAYRLHARFHPDRGAPVEGLWFARSDCDSLLMSAMGNLMTDFRFHHSPIAVQDRPDAVALSIRALDAPAQAVVGRDAPAILPAHSAFGSLDEAAAFLEYKPFGLSVDAGGRVNVVKIVRREEDWRARLVPVIEEHWSFFDDKATRPEVCFQVEPIAYQWNRGTISPSPARITPTTGPS